MKLDEHDDFGGLQRDLLATGATATLTVAV